MRSRAEGSGTEDQAFFTWSPCHPATLSFHVKWASYWNIRTDLTERITANEHTANRADYRRKQRHWFRNRPAACPTRYQGAARSERFGKRPGGCLETAQRRA